MTWIVPYKSWLGSMLPLVPVHLPGIGVVDALADSGAAISLFDVAIANALGIDIEAGERRDLRGVGGRILAYGHDVPVKVMEHPLTLKVFFSFDYRTSVNILGRSDFFRRFRVTFDEAGQRMLLESAPP